MIKAKEFEGKYYFGDCTHNILISINILFVLFFYFVLLILQEFWCIQISGMPGGTSLPLISFVRILVYITSIAPKRTQVVHVNKGDDNIVIAQSTHDAIMGPMTRSKAK